MSPNSVSLVIWLVTGIFIFQKFKIESKQKTLTDDGTVMAWGVLGPGTGEGHCDSDIILRVDRPDELNWNVRPRCSLFKLSFIHKMYVN